MSAEGTTTTPTDGWTLTKVQVANQLGVHPVTVVAWANKGKLPCWRTPAGHRRFRQSDIDAFIALGRT